MAHIRKQIRDGASAAVTGLSLTGANVFQARPYALAEGQLPALQMAVLGESIARSATGAPPEQTRSARLVIQAEAAASGSGDPQDTLDEIGVEVEAAVFAWAEAQDWISDHALTQTDFTFGEAGELRTGRLTMTWTIEAQTREGAPDTPI